MFTYQKKPVTVEAFKFKNNLIDNHTDNYYVPEWAKKAFAQGIMFFKHGDLYIKTLEGNHKVTNGDYIIKGVIGELYPCKPDIFEKTYIKND